jgi:cyclase
MFNKRIIPVLNLNKEGHLIHRKNFSIESERYVGDPLNTIRVFNDYSVDEMVIVDVDATMFKRNLQFDLLKDLAAESFFPLAYGGGLNNLKDIEKILRMGFEKVIINNFINNDYNFIKECAKKFGSQSIMVSLDFIRSNNSFFIYNYFEKKNVVNKNIIEHILKIQEFGAGEILLTDVMNDGNMSGYNLDILELLQFVKIPIIYKGGGSTYKDIKLLFSRLVSGLASSTIFIMKKINGGIVINYPSEQEKENYNEFNKM